MGNERLACHRAVSRYNIDDSCRQSGFRNNKLHELKQGCGRVFGWLDDYGAPGSQRRRELPGCQHQRRIPWCDEGADAYWLPENVVEVIRAIDRNHGTLDFVGETSIVVKPFRHVFGLRYHFGNELSVVPYFHLTEVLGMLLNEHALGVIFGHSPLSKAREAASTA